MRAFATAAAGLLFAFAAFEPASAVLDPKAWGEGEGTDGWGSDEYCADPTNTNACCCTSMTVGTQPNAVDCSEEDQVACYIYQWKRVLKNNFDKKTGKGDYAEGLYHDGDRIWILVCGILVFFMQCGFAMLEAGQTRKKNTSNIIFKNIMDCCFAALSFFCVGYAFAYGKDDNGTAGKFIGKNNFFLMHTDNEESTQHSWFFQFAFAATAATIVSGAVAERTQICAYFIYSLVITGFIYPVVVHWVWCTGGWLSAFNHRDSRLGENGFIDFAGSGVVHAVGGWAALCGAYFVGPRIGRFPPRNLDGTLADESPEDKAARATRFKGQSTMLTALGVFILWFGWYGFNCGSTLAWGSATTAGKVATTTTLAAAAGGLVSVFLGRLIEGRWPLVVGLNGVLAGLVSITAGCSVVDEWHALLIGAIGGVVAYWAAELLECLEIDDPVGAFPVHGAAGVWGVLAVGCFAQTRNIERAYGSDAAKDSPDWQSSYRANAVPGGHQIWVQFAGICAIVGWTVATCSLLFLALRMAGMLCVSEADQIRGMDYLEHGGDVPASKSFQMLAQTEAAVVEEEKKEGE